MNASLMENQRTYLNHAARIEQVTNAGLGRAIPIKNQPDVRRILKAAQVVFGPTAIVVSRRSQVTGGINAFIVVE